jgi:hypothetical protein
LGRRERATLEAGRPARPVTTFASLLLLVVVAFVGGAVGDACGGAAWIINLKVFQRTEHPVLRYVWTGLISAAAAAVYVIVALVLMSFFNGQG